MIDEFGGAGMVPDILPFKSGTTNVENENVCDVGIRIGSLLVGKLICTPSMDGFDVLVMV